MKQKRILISRPDRVGDVVLSTPIPREIKKQFPDAFVAVFVRKYTKAIYENNPYVDLIITDDFDGTDKRKTFFEKIKLLKKYKFTHALMLLPTERTNWMFFFSMIPTRIGVGNKFYQFITCAKRVSRNNYIPLRSEADYCMDLARKIGVETNNISTEIHFSEEEKDKIVQLKKKYTPDGQFLIGVHSSFGFSTPNIKPFEYRRVVDKLLLMENIKVAITDFDIPKELKNIENVVYLNKSGRDFFIDIASFDLLLSSSTGPSHIAAAVKTDTLTLFCPLPACSPTLWSPQGNNANYILPDDDYCQNKCPRDPKKCWFEGEGGIDAEKIIKGIKKILNQKNN